MKKRLELAKELLSEEGVIFVSIDDNEQAYLKVLMDEIFGENNFICAFIWKKKTLTNDNNYICRLTEYILFYKIRSVNIKDKKMNNFNDYSLVDEFYNERGKYKLSKLDNASHTWSQKLDYEFVYDGQTYYPGQNKKKWQNRQKGDHASKDWR